LKKETSKGKKREEWANSQTREKGAGDIDYREGRALRRRRTESNDEKGREGGSPDRPDCSL